MGKAGAEKANQVEMGEDLEGNEGDDNIEGKERLINRRKEEWAQRFYQFYVREGTMKTNMTRFHAGGRHTGSGDDDERSGE